MKREIKRLITSNGEVFEPHKIDHSKFCPTECTIKHLGRQIYLVGYFDHYKQGYTDAYENKINKYMLLFPSGIKRIDYK